MPRRAATERTRTRPGLPRFLTTRHQQHGTCAETAHVVRFGHNLDMDQSLSWGTLWHGDKWRQLTALRMFGTHSTITACNSMHTMTSNIMASLEPPGRAPRPPASPDSRGCRTAEIGFGRRGSRLHSTHLSTASAQLYRPVPVLNLDGFGYKSA